MWLSRSSYGVCVVVTRCTWLVRGLRSTLFFFSKIGSDIYIRDRFTCRCDRGIIPGVSIKKLTLLNNLPNKTCETFSEYFHVYVIFMAKGIIYHMTPKSENSLCLSEHWPLL